MRILLLALFPLFMQDPDDNADLQTAARVIGLEFTAEEAELMANGVAENRAAYEKLRALDLPNSAVPALYFSPLLPGREATPASFSVEPFALPETNAFKRPANLEDLAFAPIAQLAALIRDRKVTCVELSEMYLARLKRLDEKLRCVITLTEDRALEQAHELDAELERGEWRGPLHGIPWGAKDLLATRGVRTTWGAKPFENQMIDMDATVVQRLDEAGAVLIAKLTLGALAWGDVWFDATTKNPWRVDQGSSGSSAGPASATAAGCVAFAIGSETLGSIISPSERCGNSSLRPTFGRVSRHGAMALSWTMDKLGPMCRSLEDCELVLAVIQGADDLDPTVQDLPFQAAAPRSVKGLRVGYTSRFAKRERDRHVLEELEALGVELVEIELPDFPLQALDPILTAEAAAAFDALTRDGRDELLVRQIAQAWPNVFRTARLIPAVEYINANRARMQLMAQMDEAMKDVDLYVHSSFSGPTLRITNATGHPTAIAPCGFRDDGTPFSVCFTGHLYDESRLLAVARAWQDSTEYHRKHPKL